MIVHVVVAVDVVVVAAVAVDVAVAVHVVVVAVVAVLQLYSQPHYHGLQTEMSHCSPYCQNLEIDHAPMLLQREDHAWASLADRKK